MNVVKYPNAVAMLERVTRKKRWKILLDEDGSLTRSGRFEMRAGNNRGTSFSDLFRNAKELLGLQYPN